MDEDPSKYRTLTFGGRTISYDFENLREEKFPQGKTANAVKGSISNMRKISHIDDGIGSGSEPEEDQMSPDKASVDNSDADLMTASMTSSALFSMRHKIQLDEMAISKLLTFDEEDDDDNRSLDSDSSDNDSEKANINWRKSLVRDLVKLSLSSCSSSGVKKGQSSSDCPLPLVRRHSISECIDVRRSNASKKIPPSKTSRRKYSAKPQENLPCQSLIHPQRVTNENESALSSSPVAASTTVALTLDEVTHIRSALSKAELESLPLDGRLRRDIERGKVCFICLTSRFGIFSWAKRVKCQICNQIVCNKCCHTELKVNIAYFSSTPISTLKPSTSSSSALENSNSSDSKNTKKRKLSKTKMETTDEKNCVGSAPSSPFMKIRSFQQNPEKSSAESSDPASTDSSPDFSSSSLQGEDLTVCKDCKDMVLQVIRSSRKHFESQHLQLRRCISRA